MQHESDHRKRYQMASNSGKFRDRNPDIAAAGKIIETTDNNANSCLKTSSNLEESVPHVVQKFLSTTRPGPGEARIFYGKADDVTLAEEITHGVNTRPSLVAGDLVNPQPKTLFAQKVLDKKEGMYASKKNAPLGKCHDQKPGLPEGVGLYDVTYGVPTLKECKAGDIVNPPLQRKQVDEEAKTGQNLYKVSHHAYDVGETYDRNYNWQRIPKTSTFGVETPHDNDGIHVKKSLKWMYDAQLAKSAHIVSKRVDDFRERTQPQLGKVHDPIKETMKVDSDHTFGVLFKPDEYGAGDIIHGRTPEKQDQTTKLPEINEHWKTSYSNIDNTVGRVDTQDWRKYGVPTIRSDLAAPRVKRISDRTNYGDESNAYGLMNPSIYSNHGVHEKDFFQERTANEIHRVIDSIGIRMTVDTFNVLWQKAALQHPQGLVSVSSFKNILDSVHPDELREVDAI